MSNKNGYEVICVICGKSFYKSLSRIKRVKVHNCSAECAKEYHRKRASDFCKRVNPTRMTDEIKDAISRANKKPIDEIKGYLLHRGKPIHRIVAEEKLGRPLRRGEIVHHIDGDIKNNSPDNLMVLSSIAEHNKLHPEKGHKKGGDAK